MCYLCSQRAARNVPVYFREQEEKEERENAKILSLAEQRKAEEEIQKEFQLKQAQRKITKEYAAFNKGALIKMTMIESVITIQKSYFYSYITVVRKVQNSIFHAIHFILVKFGTLS